LTGNAPNPQPPNDPATVERGLFLGVDGGQSSTVALIGDASGRVIGAGQAGPCNHAGAAEGREKFIQAIGGSVQAALDQAGVAERRFSAACFGLSGGPAGKHALIRETVDVANFTVTTDAVIALTGATGGKPGIIAISGTGSIAFGRNAEGRTARAGGWGYVYGDEGSAFDLVRQAVRAALRQEERWGPSTALREALLEATGAHDANDLLHRFYSADYPRARVASFATLVEKIAVEGDPVARDILNRAAQALAAFVAAVRGQLFHCGETAHVSYIGGVFQSAMLRERFRMLVELEGSSHVAAPLHGPTAGALMEAYRLAGLTCELRDAPQGF